MPKIKSYVPSWLNEPAPGHKLFAPATDDARQPTAPLYSPRPKPGPRRTIARRGTEVFVAVGKQIRWGNLVHLKECWEAKQAKSIFGSRSKKEGSDGSFELYDEEAENNPPQDGAEYEGYRVGVPRLPPGCLLRGRTDRSPVADKNTGCRRHTTTCHVPKRRLPRCLDSTYRSYLRTAGFVTSHSSRRYAFPT